MDGSLLELGGVNKYLLIELVKICMDNNPLAYLGTALQDTLEQQRVERLVQFNYTNQLQAWAFKQKCWCTLPVSSQST